MSTYIHLTGHERPVLVKEDLEAVVETIETAADEALVTFERKAGYDEPHTVEGKPVHVRVAAIAYVTPA